MLINEQSLDLVFKGFQTVYGDAYLQAEVHKDKIAMSVPSSGRDETYGWLGQFPQLREWIGPRHVLNLHAHRFTITNRKFESTMAVKRDDISDDKLGVFKPAFLEMGYLARNHPEELVFGLLASGFTTGCYDGQNFFDTDHPQTDTQGNEITVSNFQAGSEDAWYLLDTSRAVRPLIWQERDAGCAAVARIRRSAPSQHRGDDRRRVQSVEGHSGSDRHPICRELIQCRTLRQPPATATWAAWHRIGSTCFRAEK